MAHKNQPVNEFSEAVGTNGQLIDVREPNEFASGSLPGAVNLPLGDLPIRVNELDKTRPIVLLCRSGGRSSKAAKYLTKSGFDDVTNLAGGMLAYTS